MLTELQGQIERITYTNEENGYTVARLKVYGRQDLVTIIGNMIAPLPGEVVKIQGEWANHPKHGEQFKIISFKSMAPASVHGIQKYPGSGLIKGIGPAMAGSGPLFLLPFSPSMQQGAGGDDLCSPPTHKTGGSI